MKMKFGFIGMAALMMALAVGGAEEKEWRLEKPSFWARKAQTATFAVADGICSIATAAAGADWALAGLPDLPVKPMERFTFSCEMRGAPESTVEMSFVTWDHEKVLRWSFAGTRAELTHSWKTFTRKIIVPYGVTKLQPRVIGSGMSRFEIRNVRFSRDGEAVAAPRGSLKLGGAAFSFGQDGFSFSAGGFESEKDGSWMVLSAKTTKDAAVFKLLSAETDQEYDATFRWEGNELCVTVEGSGALNHFLEFPPSLKTASGERLIYPEDEGIGYPVDEPDLPLQGFMPYFGTGHGLCMAFFGCAADATGRGWMGIVETRDDAYVMTRRAGSGHWAAGVAWGAQKKQFGYPRRLRYVFFEQGGYVAMAKRYRAYAKATGLLKTFAEKVKQRPAIDLLLGAANIWYFGNQKVECVREMQSRGMDRLLWSGDGTAEEIAAMNSMTNVLTSRYDVYSDVMNPANFPLIRGIHPCWVTEAYPQDITWRAPDGTMRRAWGVERKDGTGMVYCVSLCDSKSYLYARKRIGDELKEKPFRCRFLDTVTACGWQECWNPAHPMTCTDSRAYRAKLLNVVSGEYGLVCGSETGVDTVVPVCDYFEGMMSIGRFRVPDAGRQIMKLWESPPADVVKFQAGEKYRLPLWELVYHDCCVAQPYWGDYNNKIPSLWAKRDLFSALYGTPPMYMFDRKRWKAQADRFAASYRVAAPVSRLTAYCEMTDHEMLTPDRSVQRTSFSNGARVTVNFGASAFKLENGTLLAPMTSSVSQSRAGK